jgi:ABC-type Fe2+-enterobactin transport system substrate-binding protein
LSICQDKELIVLYGDMAAWQRAWQRTSSRAKEIKELGFVLTKVRVVMQKSI